jgi:hypothetical protein
MITGCACSGDNSNNCGNWLDLMVYENWNEIGQTAGQSLAWTSGYFLAPMNLGKINNSLDTDFESVCVTGVSGQIIAREICPRMEPQVQGIYSYLYQWDFYNTQAKWAISGVGGGGGITVHSIKEWNRTVTMGGTRVEIARLFRDLAKQAKEDYIDAVKFYLKYGAVPSAVNGSDTLWGGYYGGAGSWGYQNPRNWVAGSPPYGY